MARIPEGEIERLKREVSVERLAEARGVTLRRHGADLLGLCPFHDDHEPSLVVSPAKNLWHCLGACQAGGSVIDWVMRAEGVSFRHAVERLRLEVLPLPAAESAPAPGAVRPPALSAAPEAGDGELLHEVVSFYQDTLEQSPEALAYLERRGLRSADAIDHFRLGYANRTLAYQLAEGRRGAEQRRRLQALGILRDSGHEHLNGSLVVPIFDAAGQVVEMYGRKITPNLRKGTPLHLYLPGPHAGVWNAEALAASTEIILCEALLDALSFWCAGFHNVTAAYGIEGFTADHLAAFRLHGTRRVLIAYDRDEAGDRAAEALAATLLAEGIECFRVQFPRGMDANEYALRVAPAAKSLGLALRNAVWLGKGTAPAASVPLVSPENAVVELPSPLPRPSQSAQSARPAPLTTSYRADVAAAAPSPENPATSPAPAKAPAPAASPVASAAVAEAIAGHGAAPAPQLAPPAVAAPAPGAAVLPLAAGLHPPPASPLPLSTSPAPSALPSSPPVEVKAEEVVVSLGDRRYRVRGLARNLAYDSLKVNLLAARGTGFHVDTLELYSARQRAAFVKTAAAELGVEEEVVKRDVGQVLLALERLQDEQIEAALHPQTETVTLSAEEQAAALELLRSPALLDRILADFDRCGVVGERTNKLVGYLGAVSRQLEAPLAVVIQSSSAAGKSALMDAVLAFVPEEDRVQYSAMTGQSLFYMGETNLRHKILAIVEERGAERASYALKLLQSEGELSIASTGKDPATGKLVTHEYRVEGPVMIFLTTTAIDLDEELLNRCLVLTVDEDREQTRAIHRAQREAETIEGLLAEEERQAIGALHRNAQRLLRPLRVANPYARQLTYLDSQTRTRRDHKKYLTLIRAIALLHQYQRPMRHEVRGGAGTEYIEVELSDIELANRLAGEVLGRSLDELPPQTRKLLLLLDRMVSEACGRLAMERSDYRFSRKEVRAYSGWGQTQLKCHLHRLEELEYLLVHRGGRGQSFVYELLYESRGEPERPFLHGLIDVGTLQTSRYDGKKSGSEAEKSGLAPEKSGPSRAQVGGVSGGGRNHLRPMPAGLSCGFSSKTPETALPGPETNSSSYPSRPRRNASPQSASLAVAPALAAAPGAD